MANPSQLPALAESSAREQALALEANVTPKTILDNLPEELAQFSLSRLVSSQSIEQPALPGTRERSALDVTYLKMISPNVRNKVHKGKPLVDGTVVGKTPFYSPGKAHAGGFPFIMLGAWVEMNYGRWNQAEETMDTFCKSADGVTPSMVNDWGATECKTCPHHPGNRPKWNDDPGQDERCKRTYQLIGIGGDWKDFYVIQIKGRAIMSVYYKVIVPAIEEMREENLPWYATTFMFGTKQSGNYYEYEIRNVMPTIPRGGSEEDSLFSFSKKQEQNGPSLTFQLLQQLQNIANNYISERQEAARQTVQKFLESSTPVSSTSAGDTDEEDDADDPSDDAEGLD